MQLYSQMLDPNLQFNGGTPTHALLPNSAALDAGDPAGCKDGNGALILTDQRAVPRKGRCDIGAFETILISVSITSQANALGALRTITATAYEGAFGNPLQIADVPIGFLVAGGTSATDKKLSNGLGQAVFSYFSATPTSQARSRDATDLIVVWLDVDNDNVRDSGEPQKILSAITPVELLTFSAQPNADGTITIGWQTAIETNHAGFNLYRRSESMPSYSKINLQLIAAQGNGGGASYRFIDHPPTPDLYEYLLEDIDIQGNSLQHEPIRSDSRDSSTEQPTLIFLPNIQR